MGVKWRANKGKRDGKTIEMGGYGGQQILGVGVECARRVAEQHCVLNYDMTMMMYYQCDLCDVSQFGPFCPFFDQKIVLNKNKTFEYFMSKIKTK